MKSMLAKQAPQRSPWLPMRLRQAMQTGGKRRSARRLRIGRTMPIAPTLGGASGASRPSSASRLVINAMIKLAGLKLKGRSFSGP